MSNFKKKFEISCDCFFPVPPPQIEPTGATGSTGTGPIVSLRFLYVANASLNTVEIYDIFNPVFSVCIGEFNGGNLSTPAGLAIFSLFG